MCRLSLVAERAATPVAAQDSYCSGFSCCEAQALGAWALGVAAHSSAVVAHGLQGMQAAVGTPYLS